MKKMMLISTLIVCLASLAQAKESKGAQAEAINAACAQDAVTAKCDGKKVGTGLMKCIKEYKHSNSTFEVSQGCKDAMKAGKAARKAKKDSK